MTLALPFNLLPFQRPLKGKKARKQEKNKNKDKESGLAMLRMGYVVY